MFGSDCRCTPAGIAWVARGLLVGLVASSVTIQEAVAQNNGAVQPPRLGQTPAAAPPTAAAPRTAPGPATAAGPARAATPECQHRAVRGDKGRPGSSSASRRSRPRDGVPLSCGYFPSDQGVRAVPVVIIHEWKGSCASLRPASPTAESGGMCRVHDRPPRAWWQPDLCRSSRCARNSTNRG